MRRLAPVVLVLIVVGTACSDDSAATSEAPISTVAPDTTQARTTVAPTTTEGTVAPATSVPAPQTLLPAALSRDEVPWDDVDRSWVLALFSTKPGFSGPEPIGEEVVVAYLVAPDGTLFEIIRWPQSEAPLGIYDVRPDGQSALLVDTTDLYEPLVLDLTTGSTGRLPLSLDAFGYGFTRPTGRDYLALAFDGSVEMYSGGGAHMATLGQYVEEEDFHFGPQRPWVFAPTGLSLAVNGLAGPVHVDNQGNHLGYLLVGSESQKLCHVLAWWNDVDVLVRCLWVYEEGSELVLWLIDAEGIYPNYPLTESPSSELVTGEFAGFVNALKHEDSILYQGWTFDWTVDESEGFPIYRMEAGEMVPVGDDVAGELIAIGPDSFAVHVLRHQGVEYGALITYDHDGNEIARLDAPEGYRGAIYAFGVGAP
jgi:hypothetical protein